MVMQIKKEIMQERLEQLLKNILSEKYNCEVNITIKKKALNECQRK